MIGVYKTNIEAWYQHDVILINKVYKLAWQYFSKTWIQIQCRYIVNQQRDSFLYLYFYPKRDH